MVGAAAEFESKWVVVGCIIKGMKVGWGFKWWGFGILAEIVRIFNDSQLIYIIS